MRSERREARGKGQEGATRIRLSLAEYALVAEAAAKQGYAEGVTAVASYLGEGRVRLSRVVRGEHEHHVIEVPEAFEVEVGAG